MLGGVVAFESSSLSKSAQSSISLPSAPVRISVPSRGAILLQDHDVELNLFALQEYVAKSNTRALGDFERRTAVEQT